MNLYRSALLRKNVIGILLVLLTITLAGCNDAAATPAPDAPANVAGGEPVVMSTGATENAAGGIPADAQAQNFSAMIGSSSFAKSAAGSRMAWPAGNVVTSHRPLALLWS